MNWNWIIGVVVILSFMLIIWAKVSHQTVPEVISDIIDIIKGK
jgi:hypothetical protein